MTTCLCPFQNQLLTKGMVILRDKIRFYEGESGSVVARTVCTVTPLAGVAAGHCGQRLGGGTAGVPLGSLALPALLGSPGFWVGSVALLIGRVWKGQKRCLWAAGPRSDPRGAPLWGERLPLQFLEPRRAERC